MKINIFQINSKRDNNKVANYTLQYVMKTVGKVEPEIYDLVYSGNIGCNSINDIFWAFNTNPPIEYIGGSFTVSDVVEVVESDKVDKGFYYANNFGCIKIDFDSTKAYKPKWIKALLVEPKKIPRVVFIDNTLEAKQRIVDGYIECLYPFDDEVALVCNEEGKNIRLPLNRALYDEGEICEIIAGNFLILYAPVESETFCDMPDSLIKKYSELFKHPERFYRQNGKIKAVPYNV